MAIRIALEHNTHYEYDRMVSLSAHQIRLTPAPLARATVESYSLTIQPAQHLIHWQQDPFGNVVARVDFTAELRALSISVAMVAEIEAVNPFDFFVDAQAQFFPFQYDAQLGKDLTPYRESTQPGPALFGWLQNVNQTRQDTVAFLSNLNQQVHRSVAYRVRLQPGVQTAEETLIQAAGSCRDSAWLLVQILRQLGLAARFVSGYLIQLPPSHSFQNLPGPAEDVLDLHAWAEVYLPGAGWIGLDPTSGLFTTEAHMALACSPEPTGAAPVTGTMGLSDTTLTFTTQVVRL